MYIFVPNNQQPQTNENPMYDSLMDAINIASFIIGLQNLELNITANDIDNQTQVILDDLHKYLNKQEKHLISQDNHLLEQDMRLDRLEKLIYDKEYMARKEKSK